MRTNTGLLSKVLIFTAGVAVGSFVTTKYIMANAGECVDEGDDEGVDEDVENDVQATESLFKTATLINYSKIIKDNEYSEEQEQVTINEYGISPEDKEYLEKEQVEMSDKPYVISPEEFGDEDYETQSLTLYKDGVLVNEYGVELDEEEIELLIGSESLMRFGEFENDSVFVRNDTEETDFEILKDNRNSYDVEE